MKIKLSLRVIYLCLWEKEMNWECQINAQGKRTKIIAESAKKLIKKRTKMTLIIDGSVKKLIRKRTKMTSIVADSVKISN